MSAAERMIKVTLVRSPLGRAPRQRKTVRALGLKRLRHSAIHRETPGIMGMIGKVEHLVEVEPWEDKPKGKASPEKPEEGQVEGDDQEEKE